MVIYDLNCKAGHQFEGWFNDPKDYPWQIKHGQLSCPVCGSTEIRKLPTASHIKTGSGQASANSTQKTLTDKQRATLNALENIHNYVDKHFEDVGADFPEEARKIHYGETKAHNIQGTATVDEVKRLQEEGVDAFTLPQRPVDRKKLN